MVAACVKLRGANARDKRNSQITNKQQRTGRQHAVQELSRQFGALTLCGRVVQHGAKVEAHTWRKSPRRCALQESRCAAADGFRSAFGGCLNRKEEQPRWTVDRLGPTSPMSHSASNAKSCKSRQSAAAFRVHFINRNNALCPWEAGETNLV